MRTMVAVPAMDTVQTEFCQSLANMQHVGSVQHSFITCSLIYKARNDLGQIAVSEGADFVLWLDSDMIFPSSLLVDLMVDIKGHDIITGVYHMRRAPFQPVLWEVLRNGLTPEERVDKVFTDYPAEGLFHVEGCGFGCVLMRTEVLKTVLDKYHDLFSPLPGYGEDLSFCLRARGCGYEIYCDPKIQLGHKAATIVTNETYQAYRQRGEV